MMQGLLVYFFFTKKWYIVNRTELELIFKRFESTGGKKTLFDAQKRSSLCVIITFKLLYAFSNISFFRCQQTNYVLRKKICMFDYSKYTSIYVHYQQQLISKFLFCSLLLLLEFLCCELQPIPYITKRMCKAGEESKTEKGKVRNCKRNDFFFFPSRKKIY